MYNLQLTDEAEHDLERLDPPVQRRIVTRLKWLAKNIEQIKPEAYTGDLAGLFKYRVGDYRVFYDLIRDDQLIFVHAIKHRREAYR